MCTDAMQDKVAQLERERDAFATQLAAAKLEIERQKQRERAYELAQAEVDKTFAFAVGSYRTEVTSAKKLLQAHRCMANTLAVASSVCSAGTMVAVVFYPRVPDKVIIGVLLFANLFLWSIVHIADRFIHLFVQDSKN